MKCVACEDVRVWHDVVTVRRWLWNGVIAMVVVQLSTTRVASVSDSLLLMTHLHDCDLHPFLLQYCDNKVPAIAVLLWRLSARRRTINVYNYN